MKELVNVTTQKCMQNVNIVLNNISAIIRQPNLQPKSLTGSEISNKAK